MVSGMAARAPRTPYHSPRGIASTFSPSRRNACGDVAALASTNTNTADTCARMYIRNFSPAGRSAMGFPAVAGVVVDWVVVLVVVVEVDLAPGRKSWRYSAGT